MVEVGSRWRGTFCTDPCDNFTRNCVYCNLAFFGKLVRKYDLLVCLSFCEGNIQCYSCVVRSFAFFYTHCRISRFICGCELCNIRSFLMLSRTGSFGWQWSYTMNNFLRDSFLSICDRMTIAFYMAYRMLGLDPRIFAWKTRLQLTFQLCTLHMGMSFVVQVSSGNLYSSLHGTDPGKCETHS